MTKIRAMISVLVIVLIALIQMSTFTLPAVASDTKQIHLKYAGLVPAQSKLGVPVDEWARKVEKRTNGRVKVTTYHSQSLGKLMDFPKMVTGGLCDMAFIIPINKGFELLDAGGLPFLFPSTAVTMDVMYGLYRKGLFSSMFEEKGFKPILFMPTDQWSFWFRDNKITQISQIKDMKLRGTTAIHLKILKTLGATPTFISGADLYMSLDRGTIDGLITATNGVLDWKTNEVLKYGLLDPITFGASAVVISLKVWKSLPPDIKSILQDINEEMRYRFMEDQKTAAELRDLVTKAGVEMYRLNPTELQKLREALGPITSNWVKEMEGKGFPGEALVNSAKKMIRQFE